MKTGILLVLLETALLSAGGTRAAGLPPTTAPETVATRPSAPSFEEDVARLRNIEKPRLGPTTEWAEFEKRQREAAEFLSNAERRPAGRPRLFTADEARSNLEQQRQEPDVRHRQAKLEEDYRRRLFWKGLAGGLATLAAAIAAWRRWKRSKSAETETERLRARVRELEEKLKDGPPTQGGESDQA